MNRNDFTLLTVTFNNDYLTLCMLNSFVKSNGYIPKTLIIDNGTMQFTRIKPSNEITIFDNTCQHITGQYGQCSKNHCSTIDYALKNLVTSKYVILVDNDILFKPNVKEYLDSFDMNKFDCAGEIGWDDAPPIRLFPYFCLINVEKFRNEKLNYFDNDRCIGPGSKEVGKRGPGTPCWYKDTGCSFLEDIQENWTIDKLKLDNFIVHLKCTGKSNYNYREFLMDNKELWS